MHLLVIAPIEVPLKIAYKTRSNQKLGGVDGNLSRYAQILEIYRRTWNFPVYPVGRFFEPLDQVLPASRLETVSAGLGASTQFSYSRRHLLPRVSFVVRMGL
jgi:hypothetical protein